MFVLHAHPCNSSTGFNKNLAGPSPSADVLANSAVRRALQEEESGGSASAGGVAAMSELQENRQYQPSTKEEAFVYLFVRLLMLVL